VCFFFTRALAEKLYRALDHGRTLLENPDTRGGLILFNPNTESTSVSHQKLENSGETENNQPKIFYDQFHPIVIESFYPSDNIIKFDTLDNAVDEFFSKVEAQKIEMKQLNQVIYLIGNTEISF